MIKVTNPVLHFTYACIFVMLKKVVLRGYMCTVISCPSLAENGHVNNENWCESKALSSFILPSADFSV